MGVYTIAHFIIKSVERTNNNSFCILDSFLEEEATEEEHRLIKYLEIYYNSISFEPKTKDVNERVIELENMAIDKDLKIVDSINYIKQNKSNEMNKEKCSKNFSFKNSIFIYVINGEYRPEYLQKKKKIKLNVKLVFNGFASLWAYSGDISSIFLFINSVSPFGAN